MRTRLFAFALILSTSAGLVLSQTTPTAPEAGAPAPAATPAVSTPAPAAPAVSTPAPATSEKPAAPVVTVQGTEPAGTGVSRNHDTLSVDFPDEDIRTILRNVADLFELNLVIPDTLQGKTSIKLHNVTWRQIFNVILTPVGYTYIEDGGIIKVVSMESLAQEPVNTEVFTLNYARAADIQPVVAAMVDSAAGGKLVVDNRTNSLIITERPSRMNKIRPIVEQLDKATDQVMIESKFVEVSNSDIKNIGVNWSSLDGYKLGVGSISQAWSRGRTQTENQGPNGFTNNTTTTSTNNSTNSTTTGSQLTTQTQTVYDPNTGQSTTTTTLVPVPTDTTSTTNSSGLNTTGNNVLSALYNVATTGTTSRLASAVFSASDFNVVLSALKTLNRIKIVSNPTIVTLNNSEASINIGSQYPIPNYTYNQEHGSFEVSGFTYKDIGIILKVTPQVNARGFIRLSLEPTVSQQNGTTSFGGAGGAQIPIIATRTAKTQVSMKDGYTMAIGGLMRTQTTRGGTRVPLLGDIPVLGKLFQSHTRDEEVNNLIIFITAKTISAEGASPEETISPAQLRGLGMRRDELPGYRDNSDPFLPAEPAKPADQADDKM